jgi:hypothetical protein
VSGSDDRDLGELGLDDALRADLQLAGRLDDVPAESVAAAKASFAWRTMDAELAELAADSADEGRLLAGVRGQGAARMLTFESSTLTVEVEVLELGNRRRLVGQLVPAQLGQVQARHTGGTVTVSADELGRFSVDDLAPGPLSLHCSGVIGGSEITTDWVSI